MSDHIIVATRKGLFDVDRSDRGWRVAKLDFFGDNCTLAVHDPRTGDRFVALDHGHFGNKLHRSRDEGRTWEEIAVPEYPPYPEGDEPKANAMSGKVIPWKLRLIWALQPGGADQNGRLWCGTLPGGLFRSDDNGDSWSLARSLWDRPEREEWFGGGYDEPGIHSVCVDPRDSTRLTLGISCGGAWRSDDDGGTWRPSSKGMRADYMPPENAYDENIQDPHLLVQCPAEPDKLWVQHHNGIFRSVDGGATWTEIERQEPSSFGFAVAVHPRDGDTAWVVPAHSDERRVPVDGRVVVNRTRDGGRTFETLRKGLPQQHAYDLTFRHALDIDESGDRLAFGSTTGSLWVTEDQGDTWQTVSANLPPVHSVRFIRN